MCSVSFVQYKNNRQAGHQPVWVKKIDIYLLSKQQSIFIYLPPPEYVQKIDILFLIPNHEKFYSLLYKQH